MKCPRQRARHRKAAEPGKTATKPDGATMPGSTESASNTGTTGSSRKVRMSPEAWERLGKFGVALLNATAQLIDAIKLH